MVPPEPTPLIDQVVVAAEVPVPVPAHTAAPAAARALQSAAAPEQQDRGGAAREQLGLVDQKSWLERALCCFSKRRMRWSWSRRGRREGETNEDDLEAAFDSSGDAVAATAPGVSVARQLQLQLMQQSQELQGQPRPPLLPSPPRSYNASEGRVVGIADDTIEIAYRAVAFWLVRRASSDIASPAAATASGEAAASHNIGVGEAASSLAEHFVLRSPASCSSSSVTPLAAVAARQGYVPSSASALDSGAFDEEQFLERRSCISRLDCLSCLYGRLDFCPESLMEVLQQLGALSLASRGGEGSHQEAGSVAAIVVLCAVYIERLLARNPAVHLTARNWRPLIIASIRVASKAHEDIHTWNGDFALYVNRVMGLPVSAASLHSLELRFLAGLGFRLEVRSDVYHTYATALGLLSDPPAAAASAAAAAAAAVLHSSGDELARRDAPPLYRWQPPPRLLKMDEECGRQVSCGSLSSAWSRGSTSTSCGSLTSTISPTSMPSRPALDEASAP